MEKLRRGWVLEARFAVGRRDGELLLVQVGSGPEILYATKTVASFTQSPTVSAMAKLKREVRYLLGFPQTEWVYSRHHVPKYLDVHRDSDWAGDWAGDEERKRSTGVSSSEVILLTLRQRRNRWSRCPAWRLSSTLATAGPRENCKRATS